MSDKPFESFNIQDLPDNWYDVIYIEGNAFIDRLSQYPTELGIMISQVVMQTVLYNTLKKEFREAFLVKMLGAFLEQFEEWEEEDIENGQEGQE